MDSSFYLENEDNLINGGGRHYSKSAKVFKGSQGARRSHAERHFSKDGRERKEKIDGMYKN